VALVISLVLAILARRGRSLLACMLASGAAVAAGWYMLTTGRWSWTPHQPAEMLLFLAAAALLVALAVQWYAPGRGPWPALLVIAVGCAWWMAGAPTTRDAFDDASRTIIAIVAIVIVVAYLSGAMAGPADPLKPVMASGAMAAGLHVVGASSEWVMIALVPAAAALPLVLVPRLPAIAMLPLAADLAAAGIAASLSIGRLAHLRVTSADAAVVSPVLALLLMPRVTLGCRRLGRLARPVAALVCGALAVGVAYGVMRLRR
jgi:hypothetical protein